MAGILAIGLAFALRSFVWLVALPIVFVAEFGSNPYNPLKPLFNFVAVLAVVILIGGVFASSALTGGMSAFFIVPYWVNHIFYNRNREKLRWVALDSEKVFIYLYQTKNLGLMDSTGNVQWCR